VQRDLRIDPHDAARRPWLAFLSDGLPEARHEAVLALLRACFFGVGAAVLLLTPGNLALPALLNGLVALGSVALAAVAASVASAQLARRIGAWSTVADVVAYAAYTAVFHSTPGASSFAAFWVLLAGPIRYGFRGLAYTTLPVAAIVAFWPPVQTTGEVQSAGQSLALCLLFSIPAVLIRAVVVRGSSRLHMAEQQFSTAFEHASIGMALTERDLVVFQANRALGLLVGMSSTEVVGRRIDLFADVVDQHELGAALEALSPQAPSVRLEVRLRRADGGLRWGHVSASLLSGPGGSGRLVIQIENITERKRSEAMLSHAAAHDALTDLPNRSLLLTRLDAAAAHGDQVGLLFIDLDRFKVVNDVLGHAAGDLLLVQIAIRLRDSMRPEDMVARIGGDEFVILCRDADEMLVRHVAERVIEVLHQPVELGVGGAVTVGASVGVSLGGPGDTGEAILRDADTAMYAAKSAGGGRYHLFTPELRDAVMRTHELEVDLRAAVRADEITVVYQPVYDVLLGRITACEALARWHHPRRGVVSPTLFIAVAEQSDLILELGGRLLRTALAEAKTWPAHPGSPAPTVSVNVSLRQLVAPGFAAQVQADLTEFDVAPSRLCLEVTETVLAGDVRRVIDVLHALRDLGIHLSIDDFGTGHASLTYLAQFPVDQVKIDQSFVAGLGIDAGSAAIVGGVVGMAHTFDMRVVAEGVETPAQLAALRDMNCDAVQGFMLSVPRTPEELAFVLRRAHTGPLLPTPRGTDDISLDVLNEDEEKRYRLLVEGAKEVTGRLDLESVLEHSFVALARAVNFTGGSILLVENEQVRIAAAMPTPTPEALAARIPLGQGVSGSIAVTGEPRYLPDITIASTVTPTRRNNSASTGVRTWFGVPLISEGRPIGVLQVDSTEVDAFNETDRLAVLAFAPVVTLAVVCARMATAQLRALQEGL
jgi:diguanylate cyclase (GGDEF)-like protein/PAS domain S-box-containing protein